MALAALRQQGGPLQQALLPALTFQVTRLTSLAGLAEQRWHPAPAATAAAACSGASGLLLGSSLLSSGRPSRPGGGSGLQLILPGQQLQPAVQQRPIFNFAGLGGDLSKRHHERKLLGWTPRQVYDVVASVEHYSQFVPWCQRSTVLLRRPPGYLEAELEVGFQMFVERYTSKVTLQCPTAVHSRVDDSTLFSYLTNKWEFRLGPTPHTTWLTFEVDFAFKSPLYRQVASIFFEEVVQRMMGAFEGRCAQVYGPSSLHRRPGSAQPMSVGGR